MKTIFMTGGGGSGTIAATRILKETGEYRVILGDMDKWAAGLRFADKAYVLPPAMDESFCDVIKDIVEKEKVDVFVPLVDEEILKSYEVQKGFPDLYILLPRREFARMVLDKWSLCEELEKHGLPHPVTSLASDCNEDLEYPVIVKPRTGRGSRNVMVLESQEQLKAYKVLFNMPDDRILVQEKINGTEYTVSVVVTKEGEVLAVVPKEVVYKRGATIVSVTRRIQSIEDVCVAIQEKLKADGPFNVQLMLKDDGTPVVFEINPRYSTTIALTMAAGVNEIDILLGGNVRTSPSEMTSFKENIVMSRFYDQLYFDEKQEK